MVRMLVACALSVALASVARAQDGVAPVATQSVETPFVGTFLLSGGAKGALVVSRQQDVLSFAGDLSGRSFSATEDASERGPWRIPLAAPSRGVIQRLDGEAVVERSDGSALVLTHDGKGGLRGVIEKGGAKVAVTLTRKKEALVLYGTFENGMKVYAQQCSAYYRAKGYEVTEQAGDWAGVVRTLLTAEQVGQIYGRVVVVSHGGWDGPMFTGRHFQLSGRDQDPEPFGNLVRALRRGTTLDAKLIFSACHSGGSNRFEEGGSTYRYTDDLAARTGRFAYGVNGSTSTEWSRQLCQFAEGEGSARQESRVSSPGGGKTVMSGRAAGRAAIANQSLGGDD